MKCISDIGKCQNCGADVIVMHKIDENKRIFATCLKYPVMKIVAGINQYTRAKK